MFHHEVSFQFLVKLIFSLPAKKSRKKFINYCDSISWCSVDWCCTYPSYDDFNSKLLRYYLLCSTYSQHELPTYIAKLFMQLHYVAGQIMIAQLSLYFVGAKHHIFILKLPSKTKLKTQLASQRAESTQNPLNFFNTINLCHIFDDTS